MKKLNGSIVTPSYAPDFERCRLLCQSVDNFIPPSVTHYIIVPQRDLPLFKQIKRRNTEIITVESVLPWWIKRIPVMENGWLSAKNGFIRGWILQQIVKLSVALYAKEDFYIFVDSDFAFIRHFNPQSFVKGGTVRLFRVDNQYNDNFFETYRLHKTWVEIAGNLVGIENIQFPVHGYIGQLPTWRHDNLLKMYERIENVCQRNWIAATCSSWQIAEYILYGMYVDYVLPDSGHYYESKRICHDYWLTKAMSNEELEKFFLNIHPEDIAVHISSKASMSPQQYEKLIEKLPVN
ncbi:MAG: DUF6492 family protein [Nostocales cyanobacterium 94392]|nr:DUF6492 family protein [Nostocales cyanobacterium 94392]